MNKTKLSDEQQKQILERFRLAAAAALIVIVFGAVFYHFVEDMTWIDSIYFCVVTLSTVGYGDITPTTDIGKIFTIFYILIGVGIIATFVNLAIRRAVLVRKDKS